MRFLQGLLFRQRGLLLDVLPLVAYLALLFYGGLVPLPALPGPAFVPADKVLHLLAFGGLVVLLLRAIRHFQPAVRPAACWAALVSSGLGALLELLQSFTPFRAAELLDWLADSLGALLALAVLWLLSRSLPGAGARGKDARDAAG